MSKLEDVESRLEGGSVQRSLVHNLETIKVRPRNGTGTRSAWNVPESLRKVERRSDPPGAFRKPFGSEMVPGPGTCRKPSDRWNDDLVHLVRSRNPREEGTTILFAWNPPQTLPVPP